ncbi:prostatic acid phosphatase-like [Sitodiplosis mosellana]|uniref:prostatic acid phosphatase-like n=1 Tax=Sitodiplosis mosellana TaxID=263140 RepID=UPI0024452633|nr:prostatic acid phosphatase-like [Sitodiplosis mosellana]
MLKMLVYEKINLENSDLGEYELIFAHVIYRHGDRNVMESYPNDPYNDEEFWDNGFGGLSNLSKRQQYELGKYLRARYQKLIGAHYSPKKVYIRSTDEDRNLQSAQCNAAGMFNPTGDEVWNKLGWQPIPIHTVPLSVRFMEKSSGLKLTELVDVLNLYNIIYVENLQGLDQTIRWTIGAINYQSVTHSVEMKKIRAGFLIKEMLDRFKNKTLSLLTPDRTVYLYAAHGSVISNVLNSLNLFDVKIPLFSSSILFELHQRDTEYFVQVTYRKTVSENASSFEIPNCGTMCPLNRFYDV